MENRLDSKSDTLRIAGPPSVGVLLLPLSFSSLVFFFFFEVCFWTWLPCSVLVEWNPDSFVKSYEKKRLDSNMLLPLSLNTRPLHTLDLSLTINFMDKKENVHVYVVHQNDMKEVMNRPASFHSGPRSRPKSKLRWALQRKQHLWSCFPDGQ